MKTNENNNHQQPTIAATAMKLNDKKKQQIEGGIRRNLDRVYHKARQINLSPQDRLVIFSDLHIGDGGRKDDFARNGPLFLHLLKNYYLHNHFQLVLNGDIEELQRFSPESIYSRWHDLYALFDSFAAGDGLFKIYGNHDILLSEKGSGADRYPVYESLRLKIGKRSLFIFHGHQASYYMDRFNAFSGFVLKYVANPMGIKNYSFAADSKVRFRTEKRIYKFAREKRAVALIGHTHRPLFESLSRTDCLKFQIEQFCREYIHATPKTQRKLAMHIRHCNEELAHLIKKRKHKGEHGTLYGFDHLVPCLFNSGSAISNKGITAIEINEGRIALVHWFDNRRNHKPFYFGPRRPEPLEGSDYCRLVLKEDSLAYIFARIELLTQ